MKRYDIINILIGKYGYESYLEIGVDDGDCFSRIKAKSKESIDPNKPSTYRMTSDEFFAITPGKSYDIIFIDGLHLAEQAERDIVNSLYILNPNGTVVVHDCLPIEEWQQQRRQVVLGTPWTGDVWKAFANLRIGRRDLSMLVVDCDWGCGIIRRGEQVPFPRLPLLDWGCFMRDKQAIMNLISEERFLQCI